MDEGPVCEAAEDNPERLRQIASCIIGDEMAEELAKTFSALADPTRAKLISALAETELCVGELAALLDMSISAISHQLRLLRQLRLVRYRRAGRHIFYALDDEHIVTMYRLALEHLQHT